MYNHMHCRIVAGVNDLWHGDLIVLDAVRLTHWLLLPISHVGADTKARHPLPLCARGRGHPGVSAPEVIAGCGAAQ